MQITIDAKELHKMLATTMGAVESRSTIPILGSVLIEADPDGLTLRATNMDMQIEADCDVASDEPVRFCVPAKPLAGFLSRVHGPVELAREGDGCLTVTAASSQLELPTGAADDFPLFDEIVPTASFTLAGDTLRTLLKHIECAMSTEETRFYLNGTYLTPHDGKLRAVATDGHRLGVAEVTVDELPDFSGIIVPRNAALEIAKLFGGDEPVEIALTDRFIRLSGANAALISKLVDATYPDYRRVIPETGNAPAMIDRTALQTSIERFHALGIKKASLSLNGALELHGNNGAGGNLSDRIDADYVGPMQKIAFNPKYLSEMLATLGGDNIEIHVKDGGSPALWRKPGDDSVRHVIMPLRA